MGQGCKWSEVIQSAGLVPGQRALTCGLGGQADLPGSPGPRCYPPYGCCSTCTGQGTGIAVPYHTNTVRKEKEQKRLHLLATNCRRKFDKKPSFLPGAPGQTSSLLLKHACKAIVGYFGRLQPLQRVWGGGRGWRSKTKAKGHSSMTIREGMYMICTACTASARADFCI